MIGRWRMIWDGGDFPLQGPPTRDGQDLTAWLTDAVGDGLCEWDRVGFDLRFWGRYDCRFVGPDGVVRDPVEDPSHFPELLRGSGQKAGTHCWGREERVFVDTATGEAVARVVYHDEGTGACCRREGRADGPAMVWENRALAPTKKGVAGC